MPIRADADGDELLRTASAPSGSGEVTVMVWAQRVDDGGNWEAFADLSQNSSNYWYMGCDNNPNAPQTMWIDRGGTENTIVLGDLGSDTGWYCNVMMKDTSDVYRYWVRAPGDTSWTTGSVTNANGSHTISQVKLFDNIFNNEWWDGSLVALKIWERAMSEDEAFAESMQNVPISVESLWGWYPLGNVIADSGIDYSGNGRDLTEAGSLVVDNDGPPIIWDAHPGRLIVPAGVADQTLTGVLFSRPPSFISGQLTTGDTGLLAHFATMI